MGELSALLVINLCSVCRARHDNMAHMGACYRALDGVALRPGARPTWRSMWPRPSVTGGLEPVFGAQGSRLAGLAGLLLVFAVYAVLWVISITWTWDQAQATGVVVGERASLSGRARLSASAAAA